MIVGEPLRTRIEDFLRHVGEPYIKVENVSDEQMEYIKEHYIPRIIGLSENVKMSIMQILEDSWNSNRNHGNVRRWIRAAIGIAKYLLMPIDMNQGQVDVAADVVVRVSRWYQTNEKCGLWKAFLPYVYDIVELAWGDMEELYNSM